MFVIALKIAAVAIGVVMFAILAFGIWAWREFCAWIDRGGRQTID